MWAWPLGISHLGNSFSKVLVHETPIFHYWPGRVDCERKLHALLTGRDYQHKNIETLRYAEPKGDQDSTAKVRESYNVLWQRPSSKSAY